MTFFQAVTEPQRDEEQDPDDAWALDLPEERYSQSRQHDYFACEGPGLASMLRKMGSGVGLPLGRGESRLSVLGGALAGRRQSRRKAKKAPDVSRSAVPSLALGHASRIGLLTRTTCAVCRPPSIPSRSESGRPTS